VLLTAPDDVRGRCNINQFALPFIPTFPWDFQFNELVAEFWTTAQAIDHGVWNTTSNETTRTLEPTPHPPVRFRFAVKSLYFPPQWAAKVLNRWPQSDLSTPPLLYPALPQSPDELLVEWRRRIEGFAIGVSSMVAATIILCALPRAILGNTSLSRVFLALAIFALNPVWMIAFGARCFLAHDPNLCLMSPGAVPVVLVSLGVGLVFAYGFFVHLGRKIIRG
jgi:hypothetical protein